MGEKANNFWAKTKFFALNSKALAALGTQKKLLAKQKQRIDQLKNAVKKALPEKESAVNGVEQAHVKYAKAVTKCRNAWRSVKLATVDAKTFTKEMAPVKKAQKDLSAAFTNYTTQSKKVMTTLKQSKKDELKKAMQFLAKCATKKIMNSLGGIFNGAVSIRF